jgi:hypothetical protein
LASLACRLAKAAIPSHPAAWKKKANASPASTPSPKSCGS